MGNRRRASDEDEIFSCALLLDMVRLITYQNTGAQRLEMEVREKCEVCNLARELRLESERRERDEEDWKRVYVR